MTKKVTLNAGAMKEKIRQRLLDSLRKNMGELQHTNRDRSLSPSRWWTDRPQYTTRHQMQTGGNMSLSGQTIVIDLIYEILNISPAS